MENFKNDTTVKTKILATLGPATDTVEMITKLVNAGADAFRLNFSHGSHDYFERVFNNIEVVRKETGVYFSVLVDLQGPKIRVGEVQDNGILLKEGNTIEITTEEILGTGKKISTSYKLLPQDAELNDVILLDDGLLKLTVIEKRKNSVVCRIDEGGILKSHKGMNLPGMKISVPALTEKDKEDLDFALINEIDFVALSFVRKAEDILHLKDWIREKGYSVPVIAKIEKPEAVDSFDDILKFADGIMVARGDLGVEMKAESVPIIQKEIIRKCNAEGKLVITATQMLESMIENPVPTRAEASDVANAVFDGTDVVMLSGETSVGKHPVETVQIMNNILAAAEKKKEYLPKIIFNIPENIADNLFDSSALGIADIARNTNAKAIAVFTHFGRKARALGKFRPEMPIFAFSENVRTLYNLNLYRGIIPFYLSDFSDEEKAVSFAKEKLKSVLNIEANDVILFTAGAPITDKGRKTWIRFEILK